MGPADNGSRCGMAPVRESASLPLALCERHLKVYRDLLDLISRGNFARIEIETEYERRRRHEESQWRPLTETEQAQWEARREAQSVVYYMRMGNLIKIGTSINMTQRIADLMPDEVLATEPGGRRLEHMRHQQFAHLCVKGERFRDEPELLAHVAMVRKHFGEPVTDTTAVGLPVARKDPGPIA